MSADGLLTKNERARCLELAQLEGLDGRRAAALLALDEGKTQAETAASTGLTLGQVKYILKRFREQKFEGFPDVELAVEAAEVHQAAAEELASPPDRAQQLMAEIDRLAQRLHKQAPSFVPPPYSAQKFLSILREQIDAFTPEVFKEIRENLQEATADDFKDPDTWKGMWTLLTYAAQEESQSVMDKVSDRAQKLPGVGKGVRLGREALGEGMERGKALLSAVPGAKKGKEVLSTMPGAGLLAELSQALEGTQPREFLDRDTWAGIWYIVNQSLQEEADELKKRVFKSRDDDDEIIEVVSE